MASLHTAPLRRTLAGLARSIESSTPQRTLTTKPSHQCLYSHLRARTISTQNSISHQQSRRLHTEQHSQPSTTQAALTPTTSPTTPSTSEPTTTNATSPPDTTPVPSSLQRLLPLLSLSSASPGGDRIYATIHIHGRPYLVTLGDKVRLPFLMPDVQPGDTLRLTHASTLGTRDYTLRGAPWVDERVFEARAVVGSVESEPMRVMEKTKRRVRKIKHVRSKHRYTELLISELKVADVRDMRERGVFGEGTEVQSVL